MPLPIDLILVRHGESEGNVAQHRAKEGDFSLDKTPFAERLTADWRLTSKGRAQAEAAGAWIRAHIGSTFDRAYTSPYARARETAGHLGLDVRWRLEPFLREREYGDFDLVPQEERAARFRENLKVRDESRFYWIPPGGGESIAQLCLRVDRIFGTLARDGVSSSIIVCHGEVMWAVRIRLERLSVERFEALVRSTDPLDRIENGQVLHYTRRDPRTNEVARAYRWVRSVNPTTPGRSDQVWQEIVREELTNEQLLEGVANIPPIVE